MRVVDFQPEHIRGLQLHREADRILIGPMLVKPEYGEALAVAGPARTILADAGPVACLGIIKLDYDDNRGHVWTLMTSAAGPHMTGITRAVKRFFETTTIRRLETQAFLDWEPGIRWMEMLGFRREGLMRQYTPDGQDAWLYARVKGDSCLQR